MDVTKIANLNSSHKKLEQILAKEEMPCLSILALYILRKSSKLKWNKTVHISLSNLHTIPTCKNFPAKTKENENKRKKPVTDSFPTKILILPSLTPISISCAISDLKSNCFQYIFNNRNEFTQLNLLDQKVRCRWKSKNSYVNKTKKKSGILYIAA